MKNFTSLFLAGLFSFVLLSVNAQVARFNPDQQKPIGGAALQSPQRSCKSEEVMQKLFETDPQARARYLRNQQMLDEKVREIMNNPQAREQRTQAIITIPVVVHIMYANPNQVTDAVAQAQIDTLNFYYGGSPFNQDSLRVYTPFRTAYGRTQIRFCLAQRTPADLPTTGITRTTTATTFTATDGTHPNSVVPAWNTLKYLNVWVVNFTDNTLGYAYYPGVFAPGDPRYGFVCHYRAFGSGGGSYMFPEYNLGKTAVHEIGHYFNLAHPWGGGSGDNSNSTCTQTDNCADTPPTVGYTFGCPSGPVLNACSPTDPGVMWQNHMDYADDACMILFTNNQATRMETALNTSPDRSPLITSNGCVPLSSAGNDAAISAIINPANGSSIGCSSVSPVVTIENMGTALLTSARINILLNGTAVAGSPVNWTGSLAQGASATVTLPAVPVPTAGANTFKIYTTLPNGLADFMPANDTSISVITKISPTPVPTGNDFETSLLRPGWSVSNPDGDITWVWAIPGASGALDTATAINNFIYSERGEIDDIRTAVINTSGLLANDSLLISFDLAHKNLPGFNDVLQVLISTDCGATFTNVWQKAGAVLATAGSSTSIYAAPVPSDWVKQKVSVGQNLFGGGQIIVVFRNITDFGNVVWLDNINISMKPRKDLQALTIVRPNVTECAPPFAPSLTVRNNGDEVVTAFKTGYILDGGAPVIQSHTIPLTTAATTTLTFPNLTPSAGTHTIRLFVADPLTASPGPDGTPANDTITRTFIVPVINANVTEGFEGTAFPPNNWLRINVDNSITWQRTASGKSSNFSAFVDNYNYATGVYLFDFLQAPPVNTAGADSLIITFDVAHKYYTDGIDTSVDNLSVLIARNCATTYTSVYSKTGTNLATAGSAGTDAYQNPAQSDWRKERIVVNLVTNPANNVIAQFRNGDAYGNNTYIDNINIVPVFKRDIEVLSVSPDIVCSPAFTPVATIRNRGTETVTAYKVSYSIGAAAPVTTTITGVTLASNATATVPLTAGTLVAGANIIKVYSWEPVTVSGTGDQYTMNDTITKISYVASTVSAPLVETFEGAFLPSGWAISNPDGAITWQKGSVGYNSNGSAYMKNFGYFATGQKDGLVTPVFSFTGVDSLNVSFDLSAATRVAATGSTPMDTLEVLLTKDCGNTFTSVYKKGGAQLQTIYDATPVTTEYTPNAYYLWRKETIDLTSFAPNGPVQIVFRNTTNNQNNVFIDNVNFTTRTLPAKLKADGYIVLPNPFADQFNIWFVQPPAGLRYITVFNAAGQRIWNKTFGQGTSNVITVDLKGKSAGIYIVYLGYSDKGNDKQVRIMKY